MGGSPESHGAEGHLRSPRTYLIYQRVYRKTMLLPTLEPSTTKNHYRECSVSGLPTS